MPEVKAAIQKVADPNARKALKKALKLQSDNVATEQAYVKYKTCISPH